MSQHAELDTDTDHLALLMSMRRSYQDSNSL